ncbi:type IV fimbrial biogenesis protein FimT [Alteromonadaceae bacterium Bs31]|nr:type IV fimbrial biogenesis protein FimT [Alteromonadaceae bacterium Bs31]
MKKENGLTLIELMIGIAVFAILVSLAAPQFTNLMRKQEMKSQASLLKSALAYARNEAISRSSGVNLCGTTDGVSCSKAKNWSAGWLVYVDDESSTDQYFQSGTDTLLKQNQNKGNSKLSLIASVDVIEYNQFGELDDDSANVDLVVCAAGTTDAEKAYLARTITVTPVGSSRVAAGSTSCP